MASDRPGRRKRLRRAGGAALCLLATGVACCSAFVAAPGTQQRRPPQRPPHGARAPASSRGQAVERQPRVQVGDGAQPTVGTAILNLTREDAVLLLKDGAWDPEVFDALVSRPALSAAGTIPLASSAALPVSRGTTEGRAGKPGTESVWGSAAALAGLAAMAVSQSSAPEGFVEAAHSFTSTHAPGWPGLLEDAYFGLLVATSIFALYQSATMKRKSKTTDGLLHAIGGASSTLLAVYGILDERLFRESPGALWSAATCVAFLLNCFAMWGLMGKFKPRELSWQGLTMGPEVQTILIKLGYSFVVSFQGIHMIAWSASFPVLYWAVMPFWYWSVKKLEESSDHMLALLPSWVPQADAARQRLGGLRMDLPTAMYTVLNFAGAVFDNFYMAAYTLRGPEGFWGEAMQDPVLSHVILVRPAAGSLTLSLLVFIGTLVYRRKVPLEAGLALNVVLGSLGPWIVLFWHKLIDPSLPWLPEFTGTWDLHDSPLLRLFGA